MSSLDHSEPILQAPPVPDSTVMRFFEDAYHQGSKMVQNHPNEAVLEAAGVAAALVLTKGRAASGILGGGLGLGLETLSDKPTRPTQPQIEAAVRKLDAEPRGVAAIASQSQADWKIGTAMEQWTHTGQ